MEKFLYFFRPYFDYIDSGALYKKPFYWLYIAIAGINLIAPLAIFIGAVKGRIFDMPAKFAIAFVLIWLILVGAFWLGFQLWWNRKDKVVEAAADGSGFVATPVFAHLIQTFGEYLGSLMVVLFVTFGLLGSILLGDDLGRLTMSMGMPIPDLGFGLVFAGPIFGFLTLVISRFLAEQIKALAAIANHTADTARASRIGAKYNKQIAEK